MRKGQATQTSLELQSDDGISTKKQQYASAIINDLRAEVDAWRNLPSPSDWNVSPETARLLEHWRNYDFTGVRTFFCQVEAIETAIWLTEVAPKRDTWKRKYLQHLVDANKEANPELLRLALKLATGAGKTTVMGILTALGLLGTFSALLLGLTDLRYTDKAVLGLSNLINALSGSSSSRF